MNTAEILRAAGYTIRRPPGLEWQEELVEALATATAMTDDPSQEAALVEEAIVLAREKTENDLHIRWVLRDSIDRSILRRAKQNALAMFTQAPTPKL